MACALPLLLLGAAPPPDWRTPDPERLLVLDTSRGRVVIELEPRVAPAAAERVSMLARSGRFDRLPFYRVIDGFVAQTGDPNTATSGRSGLPDIKAEFWFQPTPDDVTWVRSTGDVREGILGALPVVKGSLPRHWVASCTGMIGMARERAPDTANAEIYINRAPTRELDHDFTLFGRVLVGQVAINALAAGEPPAKPDHLISARMASDMPLQERPRVLVMDARGAAYAKLVSERRRQKGANLSICDLLPSVKAAA